MSDKRSTTVNRLQTPKDISDLLQVSESTVLRMAYSGDLPYIPVRSGRRKKIIRFDPMAVGRWLAKRAKRTG
ncbi:MAG: helix-turn-helix domain-containing protein [Nitrososphaerales archaeon]